MSDIFRFKQSGENKAGAITGSFVSTGYVPRCLEKFAANNIDFPREVFWTTS